MHSRNRLELEIRLFLTKVTHRKKYILLVRESLNSMLGNKQAEILLNISIWLSWEQVSFSAKMTFLKNEIV